MRRIGSGSRAIWCSRPARVRRTSPARSSTFTCFETALNDMSKGWTRSVTRAAPFASRWTISRRVGSESAAKARSRTGVVIYSTCGLNIATGPPLASDRPAILGATILRGAVFTFSACCAVAAIDPTPRNALQCERHEGVFTMTVPFFTRIHALPEVAQYLCPGGRPRSPEESAAWLQATLESYEQRALAYLA